MAADEHDRNLVEGSSAQLERDLELVSSVASYSGIERSRWENGVWIRAGGRADEEEGSDDDDGAIVRGPDATRLNGGLLQYPPIKTGKSGHLSGMAKMRNDKLRERYLAAEPERQLKAALKAQTSVFKEQAKEQAGVVKQLVSQLRETQALFAASAIHSGIAASSLAATTAQADHLKAEVRRLEKALEEGKRASKSKEKELARIRAAEKEARTRLGKYAEAIKVRDARAVGRREGREEALDEFSRWAPAAVAPAMAAKPVPSGTAPPTLTTPVLPPEGPRPPSVSKSPLPAIAPASLAATSAFAVGTSASPISPSLATSSSLKAVHSHTSHAVAVEPNTVPQPNLSLEDQERAKVRAIVAEIMASTRLSRSDSAVKAPYMSVIIAAPPPVREQSELARTTSPRPPPPGYRPSPRTPPKSRPIRPSDIVSVDHQLPAHFRPYSAASGKAAEQSSFDNSAFRPALAPTRGHGPNHLRTSYADGVADPRSRQRPSAASEAAPQPFKHNPPSFDLKSPPAMAPTPTARPRLPRGDTFADVPGHQEARDSKYPAFSVPGFSERQARLVKPLLTATSDVYPRMRHYDEDHHFFEGAERGTMVLPWSDGSSAAPSIVLSPSPVSPPRLAPDKRSGRPLDAAKPSLSTYGDLQRPASPPRPHGFERHRRVKSLGRFGRPAPHPALDAHPKRPSTITLPEPLGPKPVVPTSAPAAARPHSFFPGGRSPTRKTFQGRSGWPGTSPTKEVRGSVSLPTPLPRPVFDLDPIRPLSFRPRQSTSAGPPLPPQPPLPPPPIPPKAAARAHQPLAETAAKAASRSSAPTGGGGRPSFELPPPALPATWAASSHSVSHVPGRPKSTPPNPNPPPPPPPPLLPPSILRPPGFGASSSGGRLERGGPAATLSPPVPPPKDHPRSAVETPTSRRPPPSPLVRSRSPAQASSGTGWQSARASTVRSTDSAWHGAEPAPPPPIMRPSSRPSLPLSPTLVRPHPTGHGVGPRLRSRPPTNHGGTVASTIEEVEEEAGAQPTTTTTTTTAARTAN